ncbi:hypothetical protein D3C85_957330 [compost metagenome]
MPGLRTLDGQHRQFRSLLQLHVEAAAVGLHPGQVLVPGRGVDDQPVAVFGEVDEHVVDHPALLIEHRAVQGLCRFLQALDIVGQQMPEPGLGLAAGNVDDRHVRDIEDPAVAAHLMVLLDLRAVMQGHVPTAKVDHLRA